MKKIFYFILLAFVSINSNAQAPIIDWQKSLGGTFPDVAYSIKQTSDGGYIAIGYTWSNDGDVTGFNGGENDLWVVKLNSNGSLDWQKTLGGSSGESADISSIQQTADGGYIVAGATKSNDGDVTGNHGNFDSWIVKLTSTGSIDWQKCLGGTLNDHANSIQQTSDGGYFVTGYSNSNDGDVTGNHGSDDYWVVKLTSIGDIDWQKSLGGSGTDRAKSIQLTSDGGYIVAGFSYSNNGDVSGNHGSSDYWIVKLTSTGSLDWQKSLGGTSSDDANSIQQTSDGGYIVAGSSNSIDGDVTGNHGNWDYWVVKLTSTGVIDWQKSLGGTSSDGAYSIQQTSDGGSIVAGISLSNNGDVSGSHGGYDCWVVKLTSTGMIDWQKSLGGPGSEYAFSIQQTSEGGYIVAGASSSIGGDVTGNHGGGDYWVVKLKFGISGGYATPTQSSFCTTGNTTISISNYELSLSGTIQWEQSPDGINNWINVIGGSGVTTDTYTTGTLSTTTFFRARISHPSYADTVSTVTQVTVDLMPDVTTNLINANTVQSNATGVSYQWIDCDNGNSIINGETNQSFTAQVEGNYAVIVSNGSCVDTSSCINLFVLPTITTTAASLVTNITASSGGIITNDGGDAVTTRGVCWNTAGNPTISDFITTDGVGTGNFVSSLTGLSGGTTYKVRAYATNSVGTAYGNEISFNTTTLGINENTNDNISIHPNPTNSTFTISGITAIEISSIEILDITGKLLFKTNSPINIDLSNYENGVYLFRIIGEKNYTGKIVKE